jgi:hypothetical protein
VPLTTLGRIEDNLHIYLNNKALTPDLHGQFNTAKSVSDNGFNISEHIRFQIVLMLETRNQLRKTGRNRKAIRVGILIQKKW